MGVAGGGAWEWRGRVWEWRGGGVEGDKLLFRVFLGVNIIVRVLKLQNVGLQQFGVILM